jgi:hypothetical protein
MDARSTPKPTTRRVQRAKLRNPARAHEQRGQSEHEAIELGQIRRAQDCTAPVVSLILRIRHPQVSTE